MEHRGTPCTHELGYTIRFPKVQWWKGTFLALLHWNRESSAEVPSVVNPRAAMIQDSTPHRVFKIDELARLIASHLVLTSPKSTANLARTCRHLEVPVLSTLWTTQSSLRTLLEVLPEENWDYYYPAETSWGVVRGLDLAFGRSDADVCDYHFQLVISGDPSPEAWNKVHRYASWMRKLHLNWFSPIEDDAILKFRLNSPASGWFPALQELRWFITRSNILYADLCSSPDLKKVSIYSSWFNSEVPHDLLPAAASIISALPTSVLQSISADFDHHREVPWAYFEDAFSSAVLRCGPSLSDFATPIPLSDAAMNHLIRLPHLRTWRIEHPPPNYSASSLPLGFPPLTEFTLGKGVAYEWLSLLKRLEDATQGVTPLYKVKESLKSLDVEGFPSPIIDPSLTSPIRMFYSLVSLDLGAHCHDEGSPGQCSFKLNNSDITDLAMALPRLESLLLGRPCFENVCPTTVACLLQISVYCVKLKVLEIHFNTANIIEDLKGVSEDPQLWELRSLPRCTLTHLDVAQIPLAPDELGFETVAIGMVDIFPSLQSCQGYGFGWREVHKIINERAGNIVSECWLPYTLVSPDTFLDRGTQLMGIQHPLTS